MESFNKLHLLVLCAVMLIFPLSTSSVTTDGSNPTAVSDMETLLGPNVDDDPKVVFDKDVSLQFTKDQLNEFLDCLCDMNSFRCSLQYERIINSNNQHEVKRVESMPRVRSSTLTPLDKPNISCFNFKASATGTISCRTVSRNSSEKAVQTDGCDFSCIFITWEMGGSYADENDLNAPARYVGFGKGVDKNNGGFCVQPEGELDDDKMKNINSTVKSGKGDDSSTGGNKDDDLSGRGNTSDSSHVTDITDDGFGGANNTSDSSGDNAGTDGSSGGKDSTGDRSSNIDSTGDSLGGNSSTSDSSDVTVNTGDISGGNGNTGYSSGNNNNTSDNSDVANIKNSIDNSGGNGNTGDSSGSTDSIYDSSTSNGGKVDGSTDSDSKDKYDNNAVAAIDSKSNEKTTKVEGVMENQSKRSTQIQPFIYRTEFLILIIACGISILLNIVCGALLCFRRRHKKPKEDDTKPPSNEEEKGVENVMYVGHEDEGSLGNLQHQTDRASASHAEVSTQKVALTGMGFVNNGFFHENNKKPTSERRGNRSPLGNSIPSLNLRNVPNKRASAKSKSTPSPESNASLYGNVTGLETESGEQIRMYSLAKENLYDAPVNKPVRRASPYLSRPRLKTPPKRVNQPLSDLYWRTVNQRARSEGVSNEYVIGDADDVIPTFDDEEPRKQHRGSEVEIKFVATEKPSVANANVDGLYCVPVSHEIDGVYSEI